jgi:hypothetical protein
MLEDMRVRPAECISETSSDISLNLNNMRSVFGYTTLYAILDGGKNVFKRNRI